MELGLKGKSVVITGGASGLGFETARYVLAEGARVTIADRDEESLARATGALRENGEVESFSMDVRDYAACEALAAHAMETFGAIDVLVASAGVGGANDFFLDTQPSGWDAMIDINIRGVMNTNRAIAPHMVERKWGSIVNIASEAGKVGEKRIVVYSATKGAVMSFTKAFALEMGRYNVRVNAVCPGVTRTSMTTVYGGPGDERYEAAAKLYPLRRLGEPEDIASMITMLASDQAGWVTGQCISVNGGFGRS